MSELGAKNSPQVKYVGMLGTNKMITSLLDPNGELSLVQDMLNKLDKVLSSDGKLVEINSYTSEQRNFLKQRYFNLVYQAIPTQEDNSAEDIVVEDTVKKSIVAKDTVKKRKAKVAQHSRV
jgi:hypothetical protein